MMLMMSAPRIADQKLWIVQPANIDAMTNTVDSMGCHFDSRELPQRHQPEPLPQFTDEGLAHTS
jgi:hypothetical protein